MSDQLPPQYSEILTVTQRLEFSMASDVQVGALLRTLAATKPGGKFLELGTGTGLSTAWILEGMDKTSSLISIDNDPALLTVASKYLGADARLNLIETDAGEWIMTNKDERFDYIFADTWSGKYLQLNETLTMLNPGALYIIDDMLPQSNWPDGHHQKAMNLIEYLTNRADLFKVHQEWSTGVMVAVKREK